MRRKLPDTLTELIEHALASGSRLNRNTYTAHHHAAYLRNGGKGKPALVSTAGLLIAEEIGPGPDNDWRTRVDEDTWTKVCAVDAVEYGQFETALSLAHRLGLDTMPEAELLQSRTNHAVMAALGRAMSRHQNEIARLRLRPDRTRYTDWTGWDRVAPMLRSTLPGVREMEISLADAGVLDTRSTAAIERLATRKAR